MPATKLSFLASFLWRVDDEVAFWYGDENDPAYLYVPFNVWAQLGSPGQIKITGLPN